MRKPLAVLAVLLVLSTLAPLSALAESETRGEGPVVQSTITGVAVGDEVLLRWEPVFGCCGDIQNETTARAAQCTVTDFDPGPPSAFVECTVTTSDIQGISPEDRMFITVRFEPNFLGGSHMQVRKITQVKVANTGIDRLETRR